jgi:hypothetical protein
MRWPKDEKKKKDGSVTIIDTNTLSIRTTEEGVLTVVQIVDLKQATVKDIAWDSACARFAIGRCVEKAIEYPHKLLAAKVLGCLAILWMENERESTETFGKK